MENSKIFVYSGYLVEIKSDNSYIIKKDDRVILANGQQFPFVSEAEVHAKVYINRLIGTRDGWIIS